MSDYLDRITGRPCSNDCGEAAEDGDRFCSPECRAEEEGEGEYE